MIIILMINFNILPKGLSVEMFLFRLIKDLIRSVFLFWWNFKLYLKPYRRFWKSKIFFYSLYLFYYMLTLYYIASIHWPYNLTTATLYLNCIVCFLWRYFWVIYFTVISYLTFRDYDLVDESLLAPCITFFCHTLRKIYRFILDFWS